MKIIVLSRTSNDSENQSDFNSLEILLVIGSMRNLTIGTYTNQLSQMNYSIPNRRGKLYEDSCT